MRGRDCCETKSQSIARDQVLAHALQAQGSVGKQRSAPPFETVLAQIVRRGCRSHTFSRGHDVGPDHGRMPSIEVGRLPFNVADILFSSQPILPRKQSGVGIRKGAASGNDCQGDECFVDGSGFGSLGG